MSITVAARFLSDAFFLLRVHGAAVCNLDIGHNLSSPFETLVSSAACIIVSDEIIISVGAVLRMWEGMVGRSVFLLGCVAFHSTLVHPLHCVYSVLAAEEKLPYTGQCNPKLKSLTFSVELLLMLCALS